ncbi:MAG TPA: BTAD domain-containing putative transcriptional regulator, partial [Mycobacteriales bacterium]|nr:BTAD domain-containing putative transcriptional regulator [Mycobacteriales bacterium]
METPPLLASAPVRVGVLGPLELVVDDQPVRLGGPKERAVLAMLALADGERLSRQALVEGLWIDPPRTAERTVAAYLSRLRRRVADACPDEGAPRPPVIDEHPSGGTSLLTDATALDVATARGFAVRGQAAAAAGDHAWAAIAYGQALGLWRGEPLAEFDDEPFAVPARARLLEMRTTLLEQRIEAELHCGQHLVVVEELEDLVRRHPHRERLHAQLMLGLYRCGRQAEALQVYDDLRRRLHSELGVDPSPALSSLQAAVLRQDSALDLPEAVAANPSPGDAVRMSGVLTFLLTDIEDSTALWDAEPTAMAGALEVHDRLVRQHVAAHGGRTVQAQGEGDSTLNVFSRASDAVAVAVELREALAAHEWPGGITMRVRLACHTGEAQQRDGYYLGPTINRAARLRGLAAGDEIVLSEATAAVVADVLPDGCWLEDVGERRLRGLRRLERVFLLRGGRHDTEPEGDGSWSRDARESLAALLLDHDRGELHGRQAERERLRALVHPGEEQSHRLTLIAGEPGMGKTRLAAWLAREAMNDGTLVLYGRCRADLDPPFGAFLEAIGRFAARCPVAELRRHVGTDAGELARLVPELRERLATTATAAAPDPSTERYLLLRAVAGVLRSVSQSTPLLLVLDDLHWASPSTLVLLEHLVHDGPARRLAVVGTYRDTDVRPADPLARLLADPGANTRIEHIQLSGLDVESVTAWVGDAVGAGVGGGSAAVLAGLGAEIHHATAGTPFFVAEAMLRLRAGGLEATIADARADGASLALSDGSRGAVQRRLATLSHETNKVLSVAAVFGDEFGLDLVEAVPEVAGIDVVEALDDAVKARIVAEVPGAWGVYRFTHALLRQAVYTSLSDPRRVRLHRHVGEAIEERAGQDVAAQADALARHFAEAAADGQAAKAAEFALLAATNASDRLGFEEAVASVRRGLKVLDLPGADDRARRCDLLTALAAAHQRLFDRSPAKEAALAAAAIARELGDGERLLAAALCAAPDRWLGAAGDDVVDLLQEVLTTLPQDS